MFEIDYSLRERESESLYVLRFTFESKFTISFFDGYNKIPNTDCIAPDSIALYI